MKNLQRKTVALLAVILTVSGFAQFGAVGSFDYTLLENKTLFLPTYEAANSRYVKRQLKKGVDIEGLVNDYNEAWEKAMAESSYDATDYKIVAFDAKEMIKEKNKEAILLYMFQDEYGNRNANLMVTHPKKRVIARSIITGLDLSNKNDLRLMMNMLNESLVTALEVNEDGDKASVKNVRNKYKQSVIDFYDSMGDRVFLVPESEHKNEKKAAQRTADLEEALKSTWKLSEYELTTSEEIEKKRVNGDERSYYWRDFPIYTNSPLLTYHYNVVLSTDGDEVLFAFLGKKRLKPTTLDTMQRKFQAKVEKYKRQLSK